MTVVGSVPLLDAVAACVGDEDAVAAGASWLGLMERAAGHLARGVTDLAGRAYGLRVAITVGKGDNGGDGWAAARRLTSVGAQAWVVAVHGLGSEVLTGSTAHTRSNRERWRAGGGRTSGPEALAAALRWADVAVDALLGTGFDGTLRGPVADAVVAIAAARRRGVPVVACDIPTGVSSDDGTATADAVHADLTVTFGAYKRGLLLHPGAAHAGRVVVGDLGPDWSAPATAWQALTAAGAVFPDLDVASEKRTRGNLAIVAGQVGMAGAAVLCTRGALAGGAGLVTTSVPEAIRCEVATQVAPAMTSGLADAKGALDAGAVRAASDIAQSADVVVAGPGLGTGDAAWQVVRELRRSAARLVLDADALNVHRDHADQLADHRGALVITPHLREFARLLGADVHEVEHLRGELAVRAARELQAVVVVKGPGTIIAAPDGRVWVTPTGSPALATGGTGDVLAGFIGAAIATADDIALATARAVWVHGLAGELAGAGTAGRPTSEDVAAHLGAAMARARELAGTLPDWPLHGTRRPTAWGPTLAASRDQESTT